MSLGLSHLLRLSRAGYVFAREGVLSKYDVELIGASKKAIDKAEDREKFKAAMTRIGLGSARSGIAHNLEQALEVQASIGFPAVLRPSFTLGGTGGGIAYNKEEFVDMVKRGLDLSPTREILIEESLLGWKEFEMEVVRDRKDNCIIVCSIENLDPMGVHTGDSITVAPSQTLTDKEYQIMRDASIAVLREIGVDTGGSNVQFAINPADGRMIVIEMNPRVSRSSALASKATGFPIAKVAAKLAVGYTLDEIANEVTGGATPASFEPTIDYVVTKVPRFAFEKFPQANDRLTTQMKSVGEVMAIGRTFQESFQKALRGLEVGVDGLNQRTRDRETLEKELGEPGPERIWYVGDAFAQGMTLDEVHDLTKIDKWFLVQIEEIVKIELELDTLDLRGVVREVLQDRTAQIETRGLVLEINLPSQPLWVRGDHVRLVQIFDNLLSNACKFTQAPGRVRVLVGQHENSAQVLVQDTGVGIGKEMLPRLFEAFQQEPQAR